ncbi:MAG: very short patch repair endonuclease [Magnetococcales bacterium]|nr:very short patch repair endonuclease [Magnetococcales bacterium]
MDQRDPCASNSNVLVGAMTFSQPSSLNFEMRLPCYRVRPDLPGTPDFAFIKGKVVVFVDGCFWHGCPIHYTAPVRNAEFWQKKLACNLERDRRVDEELAKMGWRVVRVWEHEVKEDHDIPKNLMRELGPVPIRVVMLNPDPP